MAMSEFEVTLVTAAKSGNNKAFEELYNHFYNKIFALARMTVKNEADAEDILQQAFLSAWRNLHTLNDPAAFNTWIQKITLNQCYALLRKKNIAILLDAEGEIENFGEEEPDGDLLPAVYAERDDLRARLGKIIDDLSEVQKQTVILYYFNELKVEEISYVMECTVGTVKTRLFLARKAIRSEVEEQERKSGEKFYGIAGIPMLSLGNLLTQMFEAQAISTASSASILSSISNTIAQGAIESAQVASSVGGASAAGAAGASAAGTSAASSGAAAASTGSVAGTAGISVTAKIIIAVVATTAVIGGGLIVWNAVREPNTSETPESVVVRSEQTPIPPDVDEPEAEEIPSNDELLRAYEAYHATLTSAVERYGEGQFVDDGSIAMNGVFYAELIDFDNNEVPELLFMYGEGEQYSEICVIYGYSDGLIEHGSYYAGYWADISLMTAQNGTPYLHIFSGDVNSMYDDYYTIREGVWTLVLSMSWDEDHETEEITLTVNGNKVSENDFNNAQETHLGITSSRLLFDWRNDIDDWYESRIGEMHWDEVLNIINELERRINELSVAF